MDNPSFNREPRDAPSQSIYEATAEAERYQYRTALAHSPRPEIAPDIDVGE